MKTLVKTGILVTNLGTPSAPTPKALRRYLAEFLWDPRVVAIPRLCWWLILHGIMLRVRPKKSAKLYQKIWTEQGSPLLLNSERLAAALQHALGDDHSIALGMRYGEPSIAQALEQLRQQKIERLLILPLYPQYSTTTTASTFDAIAKTLKTWRQIPALQLIQQYHSEPAYIAALAASIENHWLQRGKDSHLLFSFHGLPQRLVTAGDPYLKHCRATVHCLTQKLGLAEKDWTLVFQSRFGATKWLSPYCDATLRNLPSLGKKHVSVICPGFAVDCLETLEEINQQNRQIFLEAGGESFHYIPALNDSFDHVSLLVGLIEKNLI